MLSDICGNDCLSLCYLIGLFYHKRPGQPVLRHGNGCRFFQLLHLIQPVCPVFLFQPGKNLIQNKLQIAVHACVHHHVFVDLGRIHINLKNFCLSGKIFRASDITVRESGSQDDQQITLVHAEIGSLRPVHAKHSHILRIRTGKRSLPHQGIADRSLQPSCQFTDLPGSIRDDRPAPDKEEGTLGCIDHLNRPVQAFLRQPLCRGLHGRRVFMRKLAGRSSHIFGNIHKNRTRPSALRNPEGAPYGVRQLRNILDNHTVLCDWHGNTYNVYLLETVLPKKRPSHIAGNRHNRHRIHVSGGNTGHQVCCPRTACGKTHANLSGRSCIAVRRMRSSLLVGSKDMMNLRSSVEFIIHIQNRTTRIPENRIDLLFLQTFHYDL